MFTAAKNTGFGDTETDPGPSGPQSRSIRKDGRGENVRARGAAEESGHDVGQTDRVQFVVGVQSLAHVETDRRHVQTGRERHDEDHAGPRGEAVGRERPVDLVEVDESEHVRGQHGSQRRVDPTVLARRGQTIYLRRTDTVVNC